VSVKDEFPSRRNACGRVSAQLSQLSGVRLSEAKPRETILGREGTQQCRVSINNGVCGDDRAAARMSRVKAMRRWGRERKGARDATAAVAMQFPLVCRAECVRASLPTCLIELRARFVRRSDRARARARDNRAFRAHTQAHRGSDRLLVARILVRSCCACVRACVRACVPACA